MALESISASWINESGCFNSGEEGSMKIYIVLMMRNLQILFLMQNPIIISAVGHETDFTIADFVAD